jgi:GAF domain-containing protein
VYTAIFAGREVAAIQVAVRRRAEPFSPGEIELARRLAHTASAALAQARLLETSESHRNAADVQPGVWHELQTPLSTILRLAERASDLSLPSGERRVLLVRITSTARDTLRLLERLEQADPPSSESLRTDAPRLSGGAPSVCGRTTGAPGGLYPGRPHRNRVRSARLMTSF